MSCQAIKSALIYELADWCNVGHQRHYCTFIYNAWKTGLNSGHYYFYYSWLFSAHGSMAEEAPTDDIIGHCKSIADNIIMTASQKQQHRM